MAYKAAATGLCCRDSTAGCGTVQPDQQTPVTDQGPATVQSETDEDSLVLMLSFLLRKSPFSLGLRLSGNLS